MALPSGLPPMAAHDATQAASTPADAAPKPAFRVDTKGTHITFFCGDRIYTITPTKNLDKQQLEKICKAFQKAFEENQGTVTKYIQLAAGETVGKFGDKYKDRSYRTYEYVFSDKGIEFRRLTPDPNNPGQPQIKTKTIQAVDSAGRGAIRLDVQRQGANGGNGGIDPAHAPPPRGPLPEANAQPHGGGGNVAGPGAVEGGGGAELSQQQISQNVSNKLAEARQLLAELGEVGQIPGGRDQAISKVGGLLNEASAGLDEMDPGEELDALNSQFDELQAKKQQEIDL